MKLSIEPLEPRIAPATMFSYTEADGDVVKASFSFPFNGLIIVAPDDDATVQTRFQINDVPQNDGLSISIAVTKRGANGDGLVQYGKIDAVGVNLGSVVIGGDLAEIDAGDGTPGAVAVKSLTVRSLGAAGTDTIEGGGDLHSVLHGSVGSLTVKKDFDGVFFELPDVGSKIGTVTIGGSVLGRAGDDSGRLLAPAFGSVNVAGFILGGSGTDSGAVQSTTGSVGNVKIGKSIVGGTGTNSGLLLSQQGAGTVSVGGSIVGGAGAGSGRADFGDTLKNFKLTGSLVGGAGDNSGFVRVNGAGSITIGGDIVGASADSGQIADSGILKGNLKPIKTVTIKGSIIGGSAGGSADLLRSGAVDLAQSATDSVTIGGSIVAGGNDSTGSVGGNGSFNAAASVRSLTLKGSLLGNSNQSAFIGVVGAPAPTGMANLVLGNLKITGDVIHGVIAAGFNRASGTQIGDVQIGSVSVGGDWRASSLSAGVLPGTDGYFANNDDTAAASTVAGFISSVEKIEIKGGLYGTSDGNEHFGFTAEKIGSLKIGSRVVALNPAAFDNFPLFPNTNVSVREIAIV